MSRPNGKGKEICQCFLITAWPNAVNEQTKKLENPILYVFFLLHFPENVR